MNNTKCLSSTLGLSAIALTAAALTGCSSSSSSSSSPPTISSDSTIQSSDLVQQGDDGYTYPTLDEAFTGGEAIEFALPSARIAVDDSGEVVDFSTPDESDTRLVLAGDGRRIAVIRDGETLFTFTQDADDDSMFIGPGDSALEAMAHNIEQSQIIPGELNYSQFGAWTDGESELSNFYLGFRTDPGDMPTTGAASYSGGVQGFGVVGGNVSGEYDVIGSATMSADFASGDVDGAFTNMGSGDGFEAAFANRGNWNDVGFTGNINSNSFSGTTSVASPGADGNPSAMDVDASGIIQGHFFGPSAAEAAGIWSLQDDNNRVSGSFGAIRD